MSTAVPVGCPAGQKGFRLDTNLCTGCGACAVACAIENELPWGTSWRWIETFNPRHVPDLPSYHLSLACNHCADAPCMQHCPALAYAKDVVTGAVLLDPDKCIGCKYCTWACPYDAPKFDADAGVVSKCTFCHHRQLEGLSPACVQQCPTGALTWGDLDGLDGSAEVPGFPVTDARPSVRFVEMRGAEGLRGVSVSMAGDAGSAGDAPGAASPERPAPPPTADPPQPKTSLRTEAPLVVFTLLAATLVGIMATVAGRAVLDLPAFLILAAIAGAASTLHLGRKRRAWRAMLNVRRSWLSREVTLFALFVGASAVVLSGVPTPPWVGWAAAALGFALLFAVDRVYGVTATRMLPVHSARVLLTGVMVAGIVAGNAVVWGGALGAKLASYLSRKARLQEEGHAGSTEWAIVRMTAGAVASGLLIVAAPPGFTPSWTEAVWIAVALLALGEVVDRSEFYLELEVSTPSGAMAEAGRALTAASRLRVQAGSAPSRPDS